MKFPHPATGNRQRPQSLCEAHRAFIEAQLRLRRNYTAIYQDLVDQFGFAGRYNSVKRSVGRLVQRAPEQFDRLVFAPAEKPNSITANAH